MRYVKLSCIEFYSFYIQQCLSIDLFSYRNPGYDQNGPMNKVCPSYCSEVFLELTLYFFLNSAWCLLMWCCAWQPDFLKVMFCPRNGENRPSLGFFECVGTFSFFFSILNFFSIWSITKVWITVIAVWLNKLYIWGNCSSIDMNRNALGQSNRGIFKSIISRAKWWRNLIFCMLIQIHRN